MEGTAVAAICGATLVTVEGESCAVADDDDGAATPGVLPGTVVDPDVETSEAASDVVAKVGVKLLAKRRVCEESLAKLFRSAVLKVFCASPDRRSRMSCPFLQSDQMSTGHITHKLKWTHWITMKAGTAGKG